MTTQTIDGVSVNTQANVYFDGKCVSHGLTLPDGTKLSVGVVLPATLTFNTGAAESWSAWVAIANTSSMAATNGSNPARAKNSACRPTPNLKFA
jgi:uncharacterized protein YaiE (UPF0345 family)